MKRLFAFGFFLALQAGLALAQTAPAPAPDGGQFVSGLEGLASGRIVQYIILFSVLSLAPSIVVMVTSFTRIIVALSFLRSGLGLQTTPANVVLVSLALFLTSFIMAPTLNKAWTDGIKPLTDGKITEQQAFDNTVGPFKDFMLKNVREKELALFQGLASQNEFGPEPQASDLRILVPAFMLSELRRGFEIGFLIVLPFLIIDLAVATITMSMGMMMLPPTVLSLPFKILFFVLIDGWTLLAGSLVRSFH
ncbi:flagellar type III secretion system pore protein FliP [Aestuariivirga litoralis]|uniref:flagellar type III secretion system pore protein FliP n=1 Tax=Aestuariivirga litoralis TaxID=2650924 RepID=UPI0018C4F478|nr:flagellar type III secretion system pore protein FliP [Aestuariivirga litoralis]MBG1233190.1 flagellar type III secretion system pore protein FliP [Aestuariivirga litoralis]